VSAAAAPALTRRVVSVSRRGRFLVGELLFERGPQLPLGRGPARPREGRLALVEIGRGIARPLRELGSARRPADVVEALLADRGLERGFAPAIEAEAEAAAARANEIGPARRDLTGRPTFTVDPASARDFDDAVSAERFDDGLRLWIHIADVAAHVRPGSALEGEAYSRATSTYVPGTVEPMLPHVLSSGACSLSPGAERLAVTAEIDLARDGTPRKASFYRSRVRSDARLDYDQLDAIFAGRAEPPPAVAEPLALARAAAAALRARRPAGALTVSTSEPEFEFEDGEVVGARSVEQTEAHGLIEQLMILTNEQVAALLERRRAPTLYRVHEQPDPQRVEFLIAQLASLDLPTPPLPDRLSPTEAGRLAAEASRLVDAEARRRGHGRDAYTSLVLRALKQAYYSHGNLGHAGLGSPAYAHFTSPIRRYPDLVAHRALLAAVGAGEEEPEPERVRPAGWHSSEREREAARLERDADDVCAAFLLERELFNAGWEREFQGEVSGVIGAGAFVRFAGELTDVYEGFLPARTLRGERYDLNETETALVGRRSGRRLRLGDPVAVRVEAVEAPRGRVDLAPARDADGGGGERGRRERR
jgi:ribonuclease R